MADEIGEIKKLLKKAKLVIGTSGTIKKLRAGSVSKVWLSSNVPAGVRESVVRYSGISGVQVVELPIPNDELGVLFKKQFSVSVAGLLKGEK